MNLRNTFTLLGAAAIVAATPSIVRADRLGAALNELGNATELVTSVTADRDNRIPAALLRDSKGVIILSNVAQGGFIVGGRGGDGVMLIRQVDGNWGNPAFIKLGGGNIGLQAGFTKGDIVLLLMNRSAIDQVLLGEVEFGGNVAGTAGTAGATAIDPNQSAGGILVYSFVDGGLFGGVTLEGGTFRFEDRVNEDFYNINGVRPGEILFNPKIAAPTGGNQVRGLHQALRAAER